MRALKTPNELEAVAEVETFKPVSNASQNGSGNETPPIRATPYQWMDPATIPPREWLYDRHLIRRFLSVDVAAGAVGKTSLIVVEALSIVTGRGLLTGEAVTPGRVWIWNGEDPDVEMARRIQAACKHFGITKAEITGRLFVDSGRKMPIVIARDTKDGMVIAEPVVAAVKQTITENGIDVFRVDPFIRSHRVGENDNGRINAVAELWGEIADQTNAAIGLVHHLKKVGGRPGGSNEITAEDARGAGALVAAARSVRMIRRMTTKEAQNAGVDQKDHRKYFRIDAGEKSNLLPPSDVATWRRLEGVSLDNATAERPADEIGVVVPWRWPDAFEGVTTADLAAVQARLADGTGRENRQAKGWAGYKVADVLGLNAKDPEVCARISAMLKTWVKNSALKSIEHADANGDQRSFLVPNLDEEDE